MTVKTLSLAACLSLCSFSSFSGTAKELASTVHRMQSCMDTVTETKELPRKIIATGDVVQKITVNCTPEEISQILPATDCTASNTCSLAKLVQIEKPSQADYDRYYESLSDCSEKRQAVSRKCRAAIGI